MNRLEKFTIFHKISALYLLSLQGLDVKVYGKDPVKLCKGENVMQPPPVPSSNPYAAPVARVDDITQEGHLELADRGIRLAAKFVDGLIVGVPFAVVLGLVAVFMAPRNGGEPSTAFLIAMFSGGALVGLIMLIINFVYLHRYGQTLAKRLFKIKIVRTDGSRCELVRIIFLRWLPVSLLGAIPLVGYIIGLLDPLMIFREDQRCLHDLIADTVVVKA